MQASSGGLAGHSMVFAQAVEGEGQPQPGNAKRSYLMGDAVTWEAMLHPSSDGFPGRPGKPTPYGVPTHSSDPSAKIWCFQIGAVALRRSIRAREAS